MNLQFYIEKLKNSKNFEKFIDENPDAYFCSGFFNIDKKAKDSQVHIDYFMPKQNKIMSFQVSEDMKQIPVDVYEKGVSEKISEDINFGFHEVEVLIDKTLVERGIKNEVQKILMSLQRLKGKDYLVVTIFVSKLGIIKMTIDLKDMKVDSFEKKSLLDMIGVFKKGEKKDKKS